MKWQDVNAATSDVLQWSLLISFQSPPVPSLLDPGEAAVVEVSSASEENDEETEDEETLNSLYLRPLNGKHRHEQDFAKLMDQWVLMVVFPLFMFKKWSSHCEYLCCGFINVRR